MIRYLIHRPTTDGKYYAVIAGLSTDAKPTASLITGSRFVEADTGARYMFDESAGQWNETDSPDQIDAAVQAWLDDHPEATTTVQDGSITKAKLHDDLADEIEQNTADVGELKSAIAQDAIDNLLQVENIFGTTQSIVFDSAGNVQSITHKDGNNNTVRTDVFTFAANSITETRTLSTGESLTIVTNTTTLQTIVTYAAA